MLKWTAATTTAAQRMPQDTPTTGTMTRTPRLTDAQRRRRRATIANKENIPLPFTSTPMVPRQRNSPLVLAPLTDILNVTPEPPMARTPERVRSTRVSLAAAPPAQRRHSSIGFALAAATSTTSITSTASNYASTLPRFEEEYSPSTALPTGQQLAMRGLLPDAFHGHPRYFATPELTIAAASQKAASRQQQALPNKRKLELEFVAIEQEAKQAAAVAAAAAQKPVQEAANTTGVNSAKMGDQTLDNLIDAILDSARKDTKKKNKSRKPFNLRRRTLLKNQVETVNELLLSPSYAAGDDPASDLSFLLMEPCGIATNFKAVTPQPASPLPPTPSPVTPLPGTPLSLSVLQQMPTPKPAIVKKQCDSFTLDTPVRPLAQKRLRPQRLTSALAAATNDRVPIKRFKVDSRNYFEIGLALPSIYV